jgi:hypothetical protein
LSSPASAASSSTDHRQPAGCAGPQARGRSDPCSGRRRLAISWEAAPFRRCAPPAGPAAALGTGAAPNGACAPGGCTSRTRRAPRRCRRRGGSHDLRLAVDGGNRQRDAVVLSDSGHRSEPFDARHHCPGRRSSPDALVCLRLYQGERDRVWHDGCAATAAGDARGAGRPARRRGRPRARSPSRPTPEPAGLVATIARLLRSPDTGFNPPGGPVDRRCCKRSGATVEVPRSQPPRPSHGGDHDHVHHVRHVQA